MKKLLVASTALVAFAAVNTAQAADPIKIAVGGYMNQDVGYVDQDKDGQEAFAEVLVQSEVELYFRGSTTLDNGLTVGVNIDKYSAQDAGGVDDVFLNLSTPSMGVLRLGQTKGATYSLSHGAPSVGSIGNSDGGHGDWINDTVVTSNQTQIVSESNDGQKIVYWTPSFGGVKAGLSYGLDANNLPETTVNVGGTNTGSTTVTEAGIAYDGDLGGVTLGADVTYAKWNQGGTTGTTVENESAIRGGLSIGVAGFTIGGSYRDTSNEGNVRNLDSNGYDIGVSYKTGPYGVSASWMVLEEDDAANSSRQDSQESWSVEGSYDLGAGVTFRGSIFGAEYDDASQTAARNTGDNDGFGVVAGLAVSF